MMSFRSQTWIVAHLLFLALTRPSVAGAERDAPRYGVQWSVVIGVNYDSVAKDAQLPKLKFAENDAKAFHERLAKNYGFSSAKNTTLLLGGDATHDAILRKIGEVCRDATADDCVIVYFSGHGLFEQEKPNEDVQGVLLPADVQYERGTPTADKVVEMKWICDRLSKKCKARHKLLILDCCHGGAVFSGGRGASVFDASRVDESVFQSPGFQAMTACRDRQKANDGREGDKHSPFTHALLTALETLPSKNTKAFTTTQLFSGMQLFLDRKLGPDQSPLCSWLDGGQGELHFFPEGEFPSPDVPDARIHKVMLAMVPSSFGRWWADETPWFMPGLRFEIVSTDPEQRSVNLEMISQQRLKQAAIETRNKLINDPHAEIAMRARHLDKLLNVKGEEWDNVVNEVMKELTAAVTPSDTVKENAIDAVDLHYLAVLQHVSREKENLKLARDNYDKALKYYKTKAEHAPKYKPLLALCLADRGWYAINVDKEYESACQYFAEARSVYGSLTPPFQIYVLCREAEALWKLGRINASKERIKEAMAAAKEVDPQNNYPLTAALFQSAAWLEMNWCEFPKAIEDFRKSTKILELPANSSPEAFITCLHNDHGVAMALRYSGESSAAVEMYRTLLREKITQQLAAMRDNVGRESNYKQIKQWLTERWVNTLERCGDCSMFGNPGDIAEASDDYRRSLRAINYVTPKMVADGWERKMRLKWALALAMPKSGVQDKELADEQLKHAEAITRDLPDSAKELDKNLEVSQRITRLILACSRLPESCSEKDCAELKQFESDLNDFRQWLSKLAKNNAIDSSLNRDDIETAMFAMRVVLDDFPDPSRIARYGSEGRITRLKDIELMLDFCRLGRRRGGTGALHFVRPYYDCAISALVRLEPKSTKQLIEVAWEAMNGKPHHKSRVGTATLVFYSGADSNCFFLDVPRGTSAIYPLQAGIDFNRILAASRAEASAVDQLALPAALRKELLALDCDVCLCWRDHVKHLGTNPSNHEPHNVAKQIIPEIVGLPFAVPLATARSNDAPPTYRFPFAVPNSVRQTDDVPNEKPPMVKEPAPSIAPPLSSTQKQSAQN